MLKLAMCLLLTTGAIAHLSGCASIVAGKNQPISVETRIKAQPMMGAYCELFNDNGKWFVTTPGSVMIQKSYQDLAVRCTKDGYAPGLATVKSTAGMVWGNILFGGLIGLAVDAGQGAGYDYPSLITVEMGSSTIIQDPNVPAQSNSVSERAGTPMNEATATPVSTPATASPPPMGSDPRDRMNRQVETPRSEPPKPGRYTAEAENFAKAEQCSPSPKVTLVATGPGFENYSVGCANGDALSVRCDFGNCRALK